MAFRSARDATEQPGDVDLQEHPNTRFRPSWYGPDAGNETPSSMPDSVPATPTRPWYEGIERLPANMLTQATPLSPQAHAELTDEVQLVAATFDELARPGFFLEQFNFMLEIAAHDWKAAAVYAGRHAQFWGTDAPYRGGAPLLAWQKVGSRLLALADWNGEPLSPAVLLPTPGTGAGTGLAAWTAEDTQLPATAPSGVDEDVAALAAVGISAGSYALNALGRVESMRTRPTLDLAGAVLRVMDADDTWKANAGLQIIAFAFAVLAPVDADDLEADEDHRWGLVARLLWIQGPEAPTMGVVAYAIQSSQALQRALPSASWFWRGLVHNGVGLIQLIGVIVDDALLMTLGCALNCTAWDLLAARLDPLSRFAFAWRLTTANRSADAKSQGPLLMWPRLLRQLLLWCPTLPAQKAAWNETALLRVQFTSLQLDASRGQARFGLTSLVDTITKYDYFPDQVPADVSEIAWAALRVLEPGQRDSLAEEYAAEYEVPTPPLRLRKLIDVVPRGNPAIGGPIPFRTRWRLPNAMRPTAWLKKRPSQRGTGAFDLCADGEALYLPFTRTEGLYYTQTNHPFSGAFGFFEPTSSVLVDVREGRVFANKLHAATCLVGQASAIRTAAVMADDVAAAVQALREEIDAKAHLTRGTRFVVATGSSLRETTAAIRTDDSETGYSDNVDEELLTVARWLGIPVLIFQREPNETSFATEIAIALEDARDALCAKRGKAALMAAPSLGALPRAIAGSVWLPGAHGAFVQGSAEALPVAISLVSEPDGSIRIRLAGRSHASSEPDIKRRAVKPE